MPLRGISLSFILLFCSGFEKPWQKIQKIEVESQKRTTDRPRLTPSLVSPPLGLAVSTEFEFQGQGGSGLLIENWSATPVYSFGARDQFQLKANFSFGYNIADLSGAGRGDDEFDLFLYDPQLRFEILDAFQYQPLRVLKSIPAVFGVWIYFPASKVSIEVSSLISGRFFLASQGIFFNPQVRWLAEVEFRTWLNQFATLEEGTRLTIHQRSEIHGLWKKMMDRASNSEASLNREDQNDLVAGKLKLGLAFSFGFWRSLARFLENIWITNEAHLRIARTYAIPEPTARSGNGYLTLQVFHGLTYRIFKDVSVDFTMEHVGRFTGDERQFRWFGENTTYYF